MDIVKIYLVVRIILLGWRVDIGLWIESEQLSSYDYKNNDE